MPQEEEILGFSNPWYRHAIDTAVERDLLSGMRVRAASPAAIVATKLAAWKGRGEKDVLASLDLHDVLVLIDGRPELSDETAQEPQAIRQYIAAELGAVMKDPYFRYLAESTTQPYGELGPDRAYRLIQQTTKLIEAISP